MSIQQISADNYQEALDQVNALFDAAPGTAEYVELDRLATLVSDYEDERYPI